MENAAQEVLQLTVAATTWVYSARTNVNNNNVKLTSVVKDFKMTFRKSLTF